MIDLAALQVVLRVRTGWLERREREAVAYLMEHYGSAVFMGSSDMVGQNE